MYELKIISLMNCPYSEAAESLLGNNKKIKIVKVNSANKKNYKNKSISTFPQVYLINNNNKLLIGGYNELKNIYDIINSSSNLQHIIKKMNKALSKKFSRKDKLRLTQLLNHKLN